MLRNALLGAAVFGLVGAAAAYIWTAFEFPFTILVPAFVGWYAVIRSEFGQRKALIGGTVGGVAFTAVFMFAVFFALTDGSPIALSAWMSAVLAAAVAGAVTGWVLGGMKPAGVVAAFSAGGMLLAVVIAGLMRQVAPAAIDVAGPVQYGYFALVMGLVSAIVGAAAGAAVSWVKLKLLPEPDVGSQASPGQPHAA